MIRMDPGVIFGDWDSGNHHFVALSLGSISADDIMEVQCFMDVRQSVLTPRVHNNSVLNPW